ncbi:MAG: helix-turn-helix transcriptional regulator [Leptolyngbyaceae cyanobacterium]
MAGFSTNTDLSVLNRQCSGPQTLQALSGKNSVSYPEMTDLVEEFVDGIVVFTEQKQLLYANAGAYKIFSQLHPDISSDNPIPDEILHICQLLIQSRHRFPSQNWLTEFDIFTQDAAILHIRSRWLRVDTLERPCLLLVIEDRQQAIVDIFIEEAEQYGLTPREKEVWMLHRHDLTYKQIATELGITPNTVKKHMRSIHAKKKRDR